MQNIKIATCIDNTGVGWIFEVFGISLLLLKSKKKVKIEIYLFKNTNYI